MRCNNDPKGTIPKALRQHFMPFKSNYYHYCKDDLGNLSRKQIKNSIKKQVVILYEQHTSGQLLIKISTKCSFFAVV